MIKLVPLFVRFVNPLLETIADWLIANAPFWFNIVNVPFSFVIFPLTVKFVPLSVKVAFPVLLKLPFTVNAPASLRITASVVLLTLETIKPPLPVFVIFNPVVLMFPVEVSSKPPEALFVILVVPFLPITEPDIVNLVAVSLFKMVASPVLSNVPLIFNPPASFVTVAVPIFVTVPSMFKPPTPVFNISKFVEDFTFAPCLIFKPPAPLLMYVDLPPLVIFPVTFNPSIPLS